MFGFGRKTREVRRAAKQDAWISIPGSFATRQCTLIDISKRGTKLKVNDAAFLQSPFNLKLSRDERAGRQCRIVRRKSLLCGVEFI